MQLINSKVQTWNFYSSEKSTLRIDNSVFGEILSQDDSRAYINNSVCDGTGGYVGSFNHSFMQWNKSLIKSSFISRENSVLLAVNSSIINPDINSDEASIMFLANTTIKTTPVALDTSAIFALLLNNIKGHINDNIPITGSAWVKSGPFNPAKITKYKVDYSKAEEPKNRILINEYSNKEVFNNTLTNWNTNTLHPCIYFLRLTLYHSFNDSLNIETIARLDTNLTPTMIQSIRKNASNTIKIVPNPTTNKTTIFYYMADNNNITLELFDNKGSKIKTLLSKYLVQGDYSLTFNK